MTPKWNHNLLTILTIHDHLRNPLDLARGIDGSAEVPSSIIRGDPIEGEDTSGLHHRGRQVAADAAPVDGDGLVSRGGTLDAHDVTGPGRLPRRVQLDPRRG